MVSFTYVHTFSKQIKQINKCGEAFEQYEF